MRAPTAAAAPGGYRAASGIESEAQSLGDENGSVQSCRLAALRNLLRAFSQS